MGREADGSMHLNLCVWSTGFVFSVYLVTQSSVGFVGSRIYKPDRLGQGLLRVLFCWLRRYYSSRIYKPEALGQELLF
jgi:hypothetical protein